MPKSKFQDSLDSKVRLASTSKGSFHAPFLSKSEIMDGIPSRNVATNIPLLAKDLLYLRYQTKWGICYFHFGLPKNTPDGKHGFL